LRSAQRCDLYYTAHLAAMPARVLFSVSVCAPRNPHYGQREVLVSGCEEEKRGKKKKKRIMCLVRYALASATFISYCPDRRYQSRCDRCTRSRYLIPATTSLLNLRDRRSSSFLQYSSNLAKRASNAAIDFDDSSRLTDATTITETIIARLARAR